MVPEAKPRLLKMVTVLDHWSAVQRTQDGNDDVIKIEIKCVACSTVTRSLQGVCPNCMRLVARAVEEYIASHWRDDDSPQSESTFGVKALTPRQARSRERERRATVGEVV